MALEAAKKLGYHVLKEEQEKLLSHSWKEKMFLVVLPTGFGESLLYCFALDIRCTEIRQLEVDCI